jgi:hypothetical protein
MAGFLLNYISLFSYPDCFSLFGTILWLYTTGDFFAALELYCIS